MKAHPQIIADLIIQYADHGIGAEIGVFKGETSAHILNATNTKMLYMIDQYKWNYDVNQWTYATKGNPETDCAAVKKRFLEEYPSRHALIIKSSEEAAKELYCKASRLARRLFSFERNIGRLEISPIVSQVLDA